MKPLNEQGCLFGCKAKHHLTIAHMMYRLWYRYTEKSIISWEINIFPDLLNQIQFFFQEYKYFGKIIESIHMYPLGSRTECPRGEFKI